MHAQAYLREELILLVFAQCCCTTIVAQAETTLQQLPSLQLLADLQPAASHPHGQALPTLLEDPSADALSLALRLQSLCILESSRTAQVLQRASMACERRSEKAKQFKEQAAAKAAKAARTRSKGEAFLSWNMYGWYQRLPLQPAESG